MSLNPIVPAAHHEFIIRKCQEVADSQSSRKVMFLMPPGSAKSTYISGNLPAWFLGRRPGSTVLACSYAHDFAEKWGRKCRNLVNQYRNELGFDLSRDSQAAGEWETTNNGRYFCAGVGAGIAGHRADLGLIDDYLGSQEDADSPTVREKQIEWYVGDFWPRLKPNASQIIIANRRHEADLIGYLLGEIKDQQPLIDPKEWEVVKFPFFAEENDVLGRPAADKSSEASMIASRLWPEWYTEEQARVVLRLSPRQRAGLWQQRPAPEDGNYFKKNNLIGYTRDELAQVESYGGLRYYAAADFACSEENDANRVCVLPAGLDRNNILWILPDLFWTKASTDKTVEALISLFLRRKLSAFVGEKGQVSKSIGPFLKQRMKIARAYCHLVEVTPSKAKDVRARTAQGMTEVQGIKFPTFMNWWDDAVREMLIFPGGNEDDFVDALAHLCNYINDMLKGSRPVEALPEEKFNVPKFQPTGKWLNELKKQALASPIRYHGR